MQWKVKHLEPVIRDGFFFIMSSEVLSLETSQKSWKTQYLF